MTRTLRLTCLMALAVSCAAAAAQDDLKEIFYAPFDGSPNAAIARGMAEPYQFRVDEYVDGVAGKAAVSRRKYNGIRYDGRGNIDLDRGTWAFFYKPLFEPTAAEWRPIASVSSVIEGYWWGLAQFILRKEKFQFQFFDAGRYSPRLNFRPMYKRWKKDEWRHLAVVWDRNEGVTIYDDGKRADSNWGRGRWAWNQDAWMLVFGQWQYSTSPFAVDEAHIYASCLTDAQIAQLAKGQKPTGKPIPITPPAKRRAHDLERMGWTAEDLEEVPVVRDGEALRQVFARVTGAIDAKRMVAQPFEGLWPSTWPLSKYGASTKGRLLELHLAPDQSFDRARVFMHRRFAGSFQEVVPGGGLRDTLRVRAERSLWRGRFPTMRTDRTVYLRRKGGWLGQIDFFRVENASPADLPTRLRAYHTEKLDRLPPTAAGRAALGETPARFDNPARGTQAETATWKTSSPAFGGFQLLTAPLKEAVAMDGVVLKLVTEDLAEPTPVSVRVKEPILPQRDWLVADAILTPKGRGRRTFTLHLKGRPLVSYPTSEVTRGKRKWTEPGREVAVLVTAANPVTWVMGKGGSALSLCLADMKKTLPVAIADQTEFAREAYAEVNEGHIWDNIAPEGWARLYYPVLWLLRFAPEKRTTMQLLSRIGNWRKEPLPWDPPKNDAGAPEWAFWQMQAFNECTRIVRWIVDNRQTDNGEFGGVWGDDTDMSEYWSDYVLAGDDDGKIADALRLFWDGVYKYALKDGVSRTIRDNLHSYEEGMGAISHQLLVDYGDPIAVEHVMRAASHYYPKWMKKNADGTYSFRSWYLGYGGVWTEGKFGQDRGVNNLMLFPAAYLTWYNRHPEATKYIRLWKRAPTMRGLVGDAYLRLAYDNDEERMAEYVKRVEKASPRTRPMQVNALLDETGMRDEWRKRLFDGAKANPWRFFSGNLPNYAGYSGRMTEYFWLAYRATGDLQYLVQSYKQACMFINNQDWLYTAAQPSNDRIPLPRTTAIRARIGALAVNRGASGGFWPRHGLSYTRGADHVAALVTENTARRLNVRFYCFAKAERDLQIRVWRLDPGAHKVALYHDRNNDGEPEAAILERAMTLDRGAFIDLKLPPRQGSLLRITAIKTHKPVFDLPDPAIADRELFLEYGDHLHVPVHNVGTKPVKDLLVRVIDGHTGEIVGEKVVPRIPAPLDMRPKVVEVEFQNVNAVTKDSIIVLLDPDRKHPDLNRHNNRGVYVY